MGSTNDAKVISNVATIQLGDVDMNSVVRIQLLRRKETKWCGVLRRASQREREEGKRYKVIEREKGGSKIQSDRKKGEKETK